MKKTLIAAFLGVFFFLPAFAAPVDDFKRSDAYGSGMFTSAALKGKNILMLTVSDKYTGADNNGRENAVKAAAKEWSKENNSDECMISVNGGPVSELWKINKSGSASKIEEWGPKAEKKSGSDFFMSGGLMGGSSSTSLNLCAGTYFFKDIMDAAMNINVSQGSGTVGLSAKAHYLYDRNLDLNGGLQLNIDSSNTVGLSFILGASNFINYRTSLDILLSMSTAGRFSLGAGITYHEKAGSPTAPLALTPQTAVEKTQELAAQEYANEPEAAFTPTPEVTETEAPTETPAKTFTPEPEATGTYTEQPTATAVIKAESTAEAPAATEAPSVIGGAEAQSTTETAALSVTGGVVAQSTTETAAVKETEAEMKERLKKEILEELKAEAKTEKKSSGEKKEGTTSGFYMEADAGIALKAINNGSGGGIKMGFGDDGIFGMNFGLEIQTADDPGNFSGANEIRDFRMLTGFDFYPKRGRSPSGFYIGPIIGPHIFTYRAPSDEKVLGVDLIVGVETGVRLFMNAFVLDIGIDYRKYIPLSKYSSPLDVAGDIRFMPHLGLGVVFYDDDPEKPQVKAAQEHKENTGSRPDNGGFYLETDTLALVRIFQQLGHESYLRDLELRAGHGDGGIFGISYWIEGFDYNNVDGFVKGHSLGLKLAADFYPFGGSPSGIYIGPVGGAYYSMFNQTVGSDEWSEWSGHYAYFTSGCEAGFRLSLGGFLLDGGVEYFHVFDKYGDSDQFLPRLQVGWMWSTAGGNKK